MFSDQVKVIVWVPTYNHVKYIGQCLDSIISQKLSESFFALVIDDCSTDGTTEIVRKYAAEYPGVIKAVIREKNVGLLQGPPPELDQFAPTYMAICEGDDYWVDNSKLQKQVDFLEAHSECSVCFHPVRVFYDDGSKPDSVIPAPEHRFNKERLALEDLLETNFIQTNSVLYRWRYGVGREKLCEALPKGILPWDWFIHLLHAESGEIGFIDEVMSAYRRHPGGLWAGLGNDPTFHIRNGLPVLRFYREMEKRFHVDLFSMKRDIFFAILRGHATLAEPEKIEEVIFSPDYMTLLSPHGRTSRNFRITGFLKGSYYYYFVSLLESIYRSKPHRFRHVLRRSLDQCLLRCDQKKFAELFCKYLSLIEEGETP